MKLAVLFTALPFVAFGQLAILNPQVGLQSGNNLRIEVVCQTADSAVIYASFSDGVTTRFSEFSAYGKDHQITLWGCLPSQNYFITLHAFRGTEQAQTGPFQVQTGPIPAFVHSATANNNLEEPGFVSFDFFPSPGKPPQIVFFDSSGQVVWYEVLPMPGPPCVGYSITPDRHILAVLEDCETVAEIGLDGQIRRQVSIPDDLKIHHELQLLPSDHILALAAEMRLIDKTPVGGPPDARVVGEVILEFDWQGNTFYSWTSFDHYDPLTSQDVGNFWDDIFGFGSEDWLHGNSLSVDWDGAYLLGLSKWDQFVKLDPATGAPIWTLGAGGDFTIIPPSAQFAQQHSVIPTDTGSYLLFDNMGGGGFSRTLEFSIDTLAFTALNVFAQNAGMDVFTPVVGNTQRLNNGHTATCFCQKGEFRLVDPSGTELWQLSADGNAYRGYYLESLDPLPPDIALLNPIYCGDVPIPPFTPATTHPGGYFTGNFVTNGIFDPAAAGPGLHTIQYHYGWLTINLQIGIGSIDLPPVISWLDESLEASPGYFSYQWYLNGVPLSGATEQVYSPEIEGFYAVVGLDQAGCATALSEPLFWFEVSTADLATKTWRIYPNPARDLLWIEAEEPFQATLYDLTGRIRRQFDRAGGHSLKGLPAGLYLIKGQGKQALLLVSE